MRIHVAGAIAAAVLYGTPAAFAADPVVVGSVEEYNWGGLYGGIHAGYGWGESEITDTTLTTGKYDWCYEEWDYKDYALGDLESFDVDGGLGGLQAGYNFQHGSLVFGLEADISLSDIQGDKELIALTGGDFNLLTAGVETEVDWLATLRGRAGFAFDRFLIYATGGLAVASVEASLYASSDLFSGFDERWSDDNTHVGWTVGGGVEAFLTRNLSLKAEYLYVDLGEENYSLDVLETESFSASLSGDVDVTLNVVKVGLNYHF